MSDLRFIPNQACPSAGLAHSLVGQDGETLVEWPVAAAAGVCWI